MAVISPGLMAVISSEVEKSKKIPTKYLQIKKINYLCAPKNVERFDRLQPLEKMLKC